MAQLNNIMSIGEANGPNIPVWQWHDVA